MATAKKTMKYVEPSSFLNPPKGYKKPKDTNPYDPKKVKEYYSKKKK